MDCNDEIWIRPFRQGDAEQVKELFRVEIAHTPGSSRAYALHGSLTRPNSLVCYLLFASGLGVAASTFAEPWVRILGFCTAILSAAFFVVHRWQLSKAFFRHSSPTTHADFIDIGAHYGVVTRSDGSSFFTGRSGFWVAERLVKGQSTRDIVGCIGLDSRYRPDPYHAELRRMAVSSSLQRRGIGRRLLEELLNYAKENKFRAVSLQTTGYSQSAVGIYQRFGWKEISSQNAPGMPWLDFRLVEYRLDTI